MKIKKGDAVGRKSYKKDIIFIVDRIIKLTSGKEFAVLKGMNIRIQADAPIKDLEKISENIINKSIQKVENRLEERIKLYNSRSSNTLIYTGKILHLDGDRRYSEKSARYYKRIGLNAIVRNIQENQQAKVIRQLLNKYKPDILVVTGHDAMLKNGTNYTNIYNYRNSRHFINTVIEARRWEASSDKLAIFARSMSKFF